MNENLRCPLLFLLLSTPVFAGPEQPKKSLAPTSAPMKQASPAPSCLADFATPLGGNGAFAADGKEFYHFSNLGPSTTTPVGKAISKTMAYHYGLHQVDLSRFTSNLLVSLSMPESSALLVKGQPVAGVTSVVFKEGQSACLEGRGEYVAFSLRKKTPSAKKMAFMRGAGTFKLVSGPEGSLLFETGHKNLIEFDFDTMQTRQRFMAYAANESPLYVHPLNNQRYAWQFAQEPSKIRGIIAYDSNRNVAGALKYEPNDRLLQQQKLFGVLQSAAKDQNLQVIEPSRWSGSSKTYTHPLVFPTGMSPHEAGIQINFEKKIAVIGGGTPELRKKWRQVFIYDYSQGKQLGSLQAPADHYVDYYGLAPDASLVMVEVRHIVHKTSAYLAAFSLGSLAWTKIPLSTIRKAVKPGVKPAAKKP